MYTYRSLFLSFIMCLKGILSVFQSKSKKTSSCYILFLIYTLAASDAFSCWGTKPHISDVVSPLLVDDVIEECRVYATAQIKAKNLGAYRTTQRKLLTGGYDVTCWVYPHQSIGICANPTPCGSGKTWDQTLESCVPKESEPPPLGAVINNGDDDNNTCNPINIATGNKFFQYDDFIGNGINPLRFSLFYNSNSSEEVWTTSYSQSLRIHNDSIEARREQGSAIVFTVTDDVFTPNSQRKERLIETIDGNYELTLSDNTVEQYNNIGELVEIRYSSGVVHSISRSPTMITVSRYQQSLMIHYNNANLANTFGEDLRGAVTRVTLPDASVADYSSDNYTGYIRYTRTIYPDGFNRFYVYDNDDFPRHITEVKNRYYSGNIRTISAITYDNEGHAVSSEVGTPNSGIERTQIEYHEDGSRTLTNALGKQTTYHFTQFNGEYKMTRVEGHPSANCASANQAYTYDANGFMASKTDWKANVTTYINNDRGLEVSRTEASGTSEARTTLTEWHPNFNLRTKITEPERETVFTYDIKGRLTSQEVRVR